jgi:hypothetical protein
MVTFHRIVLLVTALGEEKEFQRLSAHFSWDSVSNLKNVKNIESITVTFRDIFGSVFFFPSACPGAYKCCRIPGHNRRLHRLRRCRKDNVELPYQQGFEMQQCNEPFIAFQNHTQGEFSLLISKMSSLRPLYRAGHGCPCFYNDTYKRPCAEIQQAAL